MRLRFPWVVRSGVMVACASLCVWSFVSAEQRANPRAEIIRYESPGGDVFFALKLRAERLTAKPASRDHVVLIDTSASQAGAHRRQGLKVLDGFLAALPEVDRVSLVAVDVNAVRLTEGFVDPRTEAAIAGIAKLKKRVPLGSSQLMPALVGALNSFGEGRARSILYIGDGMSTGQLIQSAEMKKVLSDLRSRQIAVHIYGVGPRLDLQVLGILAEQSGGFIFRDNVIDDEKQSARQSGMKLAQAAGAPILYPDSIKVEPAVEQLLPGTVPPIRMDRDTILLGRGPVAAKVTVTVTSPTETLKWTAVRRQDQAGNTYLSALWNSTEQDAGMTLPLAGEDLLNVAREEFETQMAQMVVLGQQAVNEKNAPQAEKIAWAIRQTDPANVQARMILQAAERVRRGQGGDLALAQPDDTKKEPAAPPAAGDKTLDETPAPGAPPTGTALPNEDLAGQVRERRRIQGELLRNDVNRSIEAALRAMHENPDASVGELERVLSLVKSANEVDSQIRDSLRMRIMSAINQVKVRKNSIENDKVLVAEQLSAAQSRRQMMDRLTEREEKMTQLVDRVRSLLFEGFLGNENAFEEAEAVARAAWELDPYNGSTVGAIFNAEAAGQLDKAMRLRSLRADKFLATLHQVELSHVPFPDEPPILWPAPEVWKALTERRKKWRSMDLQKYRPTEEKIKRALESPSSVQFIETPLKDALKFLAEQHGINIILDEAAMTEDGVNIETQVNLQLSDIQLRSVLKLMLEPLKTATYLIEDEVLKITTKAKADLNLPTRVYPVGDLVIPIQSGGGIGGIGGGLTGQLGNGAGQGGGGVGGGFGGGGGGLFDVPPETALPPKVLNNDIVRQPKKNNNTPSGPAAPKQRNVIKKLIVNPQAEQVDLFEGIDKGLLDARLVPRNADSGNIFIENKSDRPLTVKMPRTFAAVQVLKQGFGGGGAAGAGGIGGGRNGGSGNGGGAQALGGGGVGGGGFGGGGFGGGAGGAGLFSVAPEQIAQIPMKSVCLEHGKPDPRSSMSYKLIPLSQQTNDPVLGAMLEQFLAGNIDQKSAQAAAWHLANSMSWQELANKKIKHLGGLPPEPYFQQAQIIKAQQLVAVAQGVVRQRQTEPKTAASTSETTSPGRIERPRK